MTGVEGLLDVVALGQAVALVPLSVADGHPRSGIVYRPVVDAAPYTVLLAWPEGSRSRTIATFVHTVLDQTADLRTRQPRLLRPAPAV